MNNPWIDARRIKNTAVVDKIKSQLKEYEQKFEMILTYINCIFIVNFKNPQQVIISFPVMKGEYFGEFVLFARVEGYETIDDIISFFTTETGNKVRIIEQDKPFPYYFEPKDPEKCIFPARYSSYMHLKKFLDDVENIDITNCTLFYEDHYPLNNFEMYKIHLIAKNSENNIIYNSIFQDSSDFFLKPYEPAENLSLWSKIFDFYNKIYTKI